MIIIIDKDKDIDKDKKKVLQCILFLYSPKVY